MKKIIILTVISIVLMSTSLIIALLTSAPIFLDVEEPFKRYDIKAVDILQTDHNQYDIDITIFDEVNEEPFDDVEIYITRMEIHEDAQPLEHDETSEEGVYHISNFIVDSHGDHYLTVNFNHRGSAHEAVLPITFPIMQPKIYINQGLNNLMFEIDPNTSWSSFIDPEGISIYRSAHYEFDEQAIMITRNLPITEYQYLDLQSRSEQPYYYLKLTGKEGRVNLITSALFSSVTQSDFRANVYEDDFGEVWLRLRGSMQGPREHNATREMQLRVGFPNSVMVENSYEGIDDTQYEFLINLDADTNPGINSLTVFYFENGTMLERTLRSDGFEIETINVLEGDYRYTLVNAQSIELAKTPDITFIDLQSDFEIIDEKVHFVLRGQGYFRNRDAVTQYRLEIGGMPAVFMEPDNGEMNFVIDLMDMPLSFDWRDVRLSIFEGGGVYTIDVPADSRQRLELIDDNVAYRLQNWNEQLKLHIDRP